MIYIVNILFCSISISDARGLTSAFLSSLQAHVLWVSSSHPVASRGSTYLKHSPVLDN